MTISSNSAVAADAVDWTRMAEPQEDGYDTQVVLRFATSRAPHLHAAPWQRRPTGTDPTIFDGSVSVRHMAVNLAYDPPIIDGPIDHPNIHRAAELVRLWPAAFRQFQQLIDSFHPLWLDTVPADTSEPPLISCSGIDPLTFGLVRATVCNHWMLAEAFVHEMAHQKLIALGVSIESAAQIVRNPPQRLYRSPVIRDRLRPMTAVLHAEYSFTYITQLNIHMYRHGVDQAARDIAAQLLAENLSRIREGLGELDQYLETDEAGASFFLGLRQWVTRLVDEGEEILRERTHGYTGSGIGCSARRPNPPSQSTSTAPVGGGNVAVLTGPAAASALIAAQNPWVFFSNGYGDYILAWPTMRALAGLFPGKLGLLTRSGVGEQFFHDVDFRCRLHVPMHLAVDGLGLDFDAAGVAGTIGSCDLLISLNPWHSRSVDELAARLAPAHSIGFFPAFQCRLALDYTIHAAELTFAVARQIDPSLRLDSFAQPAVFNITSPLTKGEAENILFVHSATRPERNWPLDRMQAVISRFLDTHPRFRVFVVGPLELPRRLQQRKVDCTARSIPEIGGLIGQADLFFGVDSWCLHLADLANVPTVGLFAPRRAVEWGVRFAPNISLCAVDAMDDLKEEQVFQALEKTWDAGRPAPCTAHVAKDVRVV